MAAGAVFMRANTYIGNTPNFMAKSIVERRGAPMSSFFGYMGQWALILLPLFGLITILFYLSRSGLVAMALSRYLDCR